MIDRFQGEYRFLSNFWNSPVEFEGRTYLNSEAAFQSAKTLNPKIRDEFTKLNPYDAKQGGKHLNLRTDWEDIKLDIMYRVVLSKFQLSSDLVTMLLETGDEELIEGNTWRDTCWGVYNGKGQNNLGKILMRVRSELKETK